VGAQAKTPAHPKRGRGGRQGVQSSEARGRLRVKNWWH